MHFTAGNDYGHGDLGADTFIFDRAFADGTINDFNSAEGDRIQISGADSYSQLQLVAIVTDSGPAVMVMIGGNAITLEQLSSGDIHVSNFLF